MVGRPPGGADPAAARRRGRPSKPLAERQGARITINLPPIAFAEIRQRARAAGLSLSAYCLRAALGQPLAPVVPGVNRQTFRQLVGVSANLNQWMRAINGGQLPVGERPNLAELRSLVQQLLREIRPQRTKASLELEP